MSRETAVEQRKGVFALFCVWAFIQLARPQDIFPLLAPLRPALVTGLVTLAAVVLNYRELNGFPLFRERQVKLYTALLLVMIGGIPFSLYPGLSFQTIFTQYISAALFFFIFCKLVDSTAKLTRVLLVGCLGSGLYAAFAVTKGELGSGRLAYSDMFDANDLAFFSMAFLPLNLIFVSRNNPFWVRLASWCSFFVGLLLIFLTGSRGGLLALLVAGSLLLTLSTQTIGRALKGAVIVLGLVVVSLAPLNAERFQTFLSIEDDYNTWAETGRLAIWKIGMRSMLDNPLTGVGVACFGEAVGRDRAARGESTLRWQTAHNSVVQIGTETGLIGLALFLLLSKNVVFIFQRARRAQGNVDLVKIGEMGLVGFAGMFTAALFLSQAYSVYWLFYVAVSAVVSQLLVRNHTQEVTGI